MGCRRRCGGTGGVFLTSALSGCENTIPDRSITPENTHFPGKFPVSLQAQGLERAAKKEEFPLPCLSEIQVFTKPPAASEKVSAVHNHFLSRQQRKPKMSAQKKEFSDSNPIYHLRPSCWWEGMGWVVMG